MQKKKKNRIEDFQNIFVNNKSNIGSKIGDWNFLWIVSRIGLYNKTPTQTLYSHLWWAASGQSHIYKMLDNLSEREEGKMKALLSIGKSVSDAASMCRTEAAGVSLGPFGFPKIQYPSPLHFLHGEQVNTANQ